MFTPQLTIPQWLQLPMPVRLRLKAIFGIPRSSGTEVVNTTVLSDGHTHSDLAVVTIEKMQAFLNSKETDFYSLLNETVKVVNAAYENEINKEINKQKQKKVELASEKIEALSDLTKEIEEMAEELGVQIAPSKKGRSKNV